jgi:serine protease inhibitor
MSIANSIWHRSSFPVERDFVDLADRYYDAAVTPLDFNSADAAPRINDWVKEKTMGKIDRIVPDPIPENLMMYLINAIYFKGTWRCRFDSTATRDAEFTTFDGSKVKVRMMHQKNGKLRHYEDGSVRLAELPYGNGIYGMVIAVPNGPQTLDSMISTLDDSTWSKWMNGLHEGDGEIFLPRFTMAWGGELGNTLKRLGIGLAFDESAADFTKINRGSVGRERIYIGQVRHRTFVEVDEEGTEAAAVTSVEMVRRISEAAPYQFVLRVDRPFFFAIRDRHSGTILFAGKVVRNRQEGKVVM